MNSAYLTGQREHFFRTLRANRRLKESLGLIPSRSSGPLVTLDIIRDMFGGRSIAGRPKTVYCVENSELRSSHQATSD
jgi:hypothetical protein